MSVAFRRFCQLAWYRSSCHTFVPFHTSICYGTLSIVAQRQPLQKLQPGRTEPSQFNDAQNTRSFRTALVNERRETGDSPDLVLTGSQVSRIEFNSYLPHDQQVGSITFYVGFCRKDHQARKHILFEEAEIVWTNECDNKKTTLS